MHIPPSRTNPLIRTAALAALALSLLYASEAMAQPAADAPAAEPAAADPIDDEAAAEPVAPRPPEPVRLALQGAGHRLLRLGRDAPSVDFPFDASGEAPSLAVAVLEASFGSPPASADGIFSATSVDDPRGPRVKITADADQLRTGAYTVRLRLTGLGVETYEPTVQISVPAPELQVPASLSVQRIRPLFPSIFGDGQASAEPLVVREVGRFAGLTAVRLTQVGPLQLDDRAEVGAIRTPDALPALAPGATGTFDYRVEPRQLPAGTVRGTLELSARELGTPIAIPVEIMTRVDPIWIILLVLIGVFLGYVSRQLLGQWRARSDALALADAERRALVALATAATDGVFRTTLNRLREVLDRAVASRDAQVIADAAAAARTGREQARSLLEARHEALSDAFGEVVQRLSGRPLPPAVARGLDGKLPPIREALLARETDRAEGLLEVLTTGAGLTALRAAWRDWKLDARQALGTADRLGDLVDVAPDATVDALKALPGDAEFDDLFGLGAAAFEAVHQFTAEVWVQLDGAVEELLVEMGAEVPSGTGAAIRDVLGKARQALVAGGSPVDGLRIMTGELPTALGAAIGAARPGPATRQLIAARQYRAAAVTPVAEIPESSRGIDPDTALGSGDDGVGAPARGRRPADPPPGPAGWQRDLAVARLALAEVPPPPAFTPPRPWLAAALGSVINAVVIALVAYVVYAEDFVGDGTQLISTLLWAYGMDLGAEAVKTQLQRVNPVGGG